MSQANEVAKHKLDCGYQLDQYKWECDCGVYTEKEKEDMKPVWLKNKEGIKK